MNKVKLVACICLFRERKVLKDQNFRFSASEDKENPAKSIWKPEIIDLAIYWKISISMMIKGRSVIQTLESRVWVRVDTRLFQVIMRARLIRRSDLWHSMDLLE